MAEFFLELFSEEIPSGLQKNLRERLLEEFQKSFLEKSIQNKFSDGKQPSFSSILCLASYRYLHNYSWCKLINFPNSYKKIEKMLVDDFKTENELLLHIPSFSKIDNEVSVKVKKQYEENPYPRWVSTPLSIKPSNIYEIVQKANLRLEDKDTTSMWKYDQNIEDIIQDSCEIM